MIDVKGDICKAKRVLILGASALQAPAILKARELGYVVAAADQNPEAVGVRFADRFYEVSTIDVDGVLEAAKDFCADGIATVATDMPMNAIAHACQALGLCGIDPDTARRATDKVAMIQAFERFGVPHPGFTVVRKGDKPDVEGLEYPLICKPIDNSGSRGVAKVECAEELAEAIDYSSSCGRTGDVLIEECMEGSEVSVEAFACGGERRVITITDKLTTGAPHFVELGHSQPSSLPVEAIKDIERVALSAMVAVGIDDGPAHIEIMYTSEGAKMIELGARLGGDFITTDLVPLSTGVDMLGATIAHACGDPIDLERKLSRGSAVRYLVDARGTIQSFEGLDEARALPGISRVEMLKSVGDSVDGIENSLDRIGYAIASGEDVEEAIDVCRSAIRLLHTVTNTTSE